MPLPTTQNIGKILKALKGEKKPKAQKIAIALNIARRAGATKKDLQLNSLK